MPKATLEFNLPEEEAEHQIAVNAAKYRYALSSLDTRFRNMSKYGADEDKAEFTPEVARKWLWEEVESHGLTDLD